MSRESTLLAGRSRAEEAYLDTIRWERLDTSTPMTQSETTGAVTRDYTTVHEGPAKVAVGALKSLVPQVTERIEAGAEVTQLRSVIHLPINTPALEPNDMGTVTAIGPVTDPSVLGKRFRVVGPVGVSYGTARRFNVEEVL